MDRSSNILTTGLSWQDIACIHIDSVMYLMHKGSIKLLYVR